MEAARPRTGDRSAWWCVAMAYLAAAIVPGRALDALPILCPFRRVTGLPCPGCGGTHAFVAAAHGDWAAAWAFNPLGVLAFGLGLVWLAVRCADPDGQCVRPGRRLTAWSIAACTTVSVAFGAWRIARILAGW